MAADFRRKHHRPTLASVASTASLGGLDANASGTATPRTEAFERNPMLEEATSGHHYGAIPSHDLDAEYKPKRRRTTFAKRVNYYIPSTAWIPQYSWSLLGGDVLAGLTVASMLIPQSISYATSLAQLSPVTGLFSAAIPGIFYAFLGTSRQLNVAPEAALSLLLGQVVSEILHELPNPHSPEAERIGIAVASIITVQVGLISFLLGFFRLGFIDVVLSRALLRGFITALAIVISVEQLIPMLGLGPLQRALHPSNTLEKIEFLILHTAKNFHRETAIISFSALAILVVLRYTKRMELWSRLGMGWIKRLPEVLIVVVVSTILSDELRWDEQGIDILGSVPISTGDHLVQFPFRAANMKYLRRTTSTAVLISIAGFLDSIVAAKQNAARFGYSISPNRELVALGASNIFAAFVPGTLPAYGSITRSKINADVGGRTQMASLVTSALVILATVFFLPWLYYLPKCVLAPVICLVVLTLLGETPHDVIYYWKMGAWVDLALMFVTFAFTIIWNVEAGILVSIVISLLLVVRRSSRTRMTILGRIPGTERWKPINENPEALEDVPGVLIVRIRENLDFANTAQLKERLRRLELYGLEHSHPSEEPRREQASDLVFHLADVDTCDASAVQIFYELCEEYKSRGVGLYITHLRNKPREQFVKGGIMELLGDDSFHDTVASAMAYVEMVR